MAFTHLRAGEFMPAYFRQVPSIVAKGVLFLPMENARIASIDMDDIAEVAARVLTSSGHEGKTICASRDGRAAALPRVPGAGAPPGIPRHRRCPRRGD